MKDTFVFYTKWHDALAGYPDDIRLEVYDAIIMYAKSGVVPQLQPLSMMAFSFIKSDIDKDSEKYNEIIKKRSEAGKKHKGNQYTSMEQMEQVFQNGTNGTNGTDMICNDMMCSDMTCNDNDKKEKEIIKEKKKFTPPTVDEVREYCIERNNGIDPVKFCDFYQMKGWMVGKNKMKDWKAAIRTWENKDKQEQPAKTVWVDYTKTAMQRRLEHAQH